MKCNTNRKKLIRLSVIAYIVILGLLATCSMAWFVYNRVVKVENEGDMQITVGSSLEISGDNGMTWKQNIDYTIDEKYTYPDVTGDGLQFYYPMALTSDDKPFDDPKTFHTVSDSDASLYFITVRLKFRTSAKTNVYLTQESLVDGLGIDDYNDNQSLYGDISRDGIAGAVRVAFIEELEDGTQELKNIWIPNDRYCLSYNKINNVEQAQFSKDGPREVFEEYSGSSQYPYGYLTVNALENTVEAIPFKEENYYNRLVTVGSSALATPSDDEDVGCVNDAKELLSFSGEGGKAEEKTLLIRIWIEGTDREAEKAHVGGKLKYKFHFISMDRLENENNDIVSQITYDAEGKTLSVPDDVNAKMQYSFNGIDWEDYTIGYQIPEEGKTKLMVRFAQTITGRSSTVKEFDLINNE